MAQIYNKMQEYNYGEDVLWGILSDRWLDGFADWLGTRVSAGSKKTYLAILKSCMTTARKVGYGFPSENYKEILKGRSDKVIKTFLTWKELRKLEKYQPRPGSREEYVWSRFLIGAYTGCRQSDFSLISERNITDNRLEYISIKTDTKVSVPIKPIILELIKIPPRTIQNAKFNSILQGICKKCRITDPANVMRAGEHMQGEKWQFVTSHTARISFATNLYLLGADIFSISKLMGHSNVNQTAEYIATQDVKLNFNALLYFK